MRKNIIGFRESLLIIVKMLKIHVKRYQIELGRSMLEILRDMCFNYSLKLIYKTIYR